MTIIPATEFPMAKDSLTVFSDKRLENLYDRMVQLNKDVMELPEIYLIAQDELCGTIIRTQYWGRLAYEELVKRNIAVVQYFMWNNKGELYANTQ